MKRIRLVLAVAAAMAMIAMSAGPASAIGDEETHGLKGVRTAEEAITVGQASTADQTLANTVEDLLDACDFEDCSIEPEPL